MTCAVPVPELVIVADAVKPSLYVVVVWTAPALVVVVSRENARVAVPPPKEAERVRYRVPGTLRSARGLLRDRPTHPVSRRPRRDRKRSCAQRAMIPQS